MSFRAASGPHQPHRRPSRRRVPRAHRLLMLRAVALCAAAVAPTPAAAQEPVVPLEGLIVTASPTARPASAVAAHVTVLEGSSLRERGYDGVADALRDVAGISVARNGSFGATTSLFMRGAESDHVQVLVDGVSVNLPGGGFDFSGLTLEHVERIEVVRGPMSALYGSDAVAGVVHVITRSGAGPPAARASLRAGSFGRLDGTLGFSGGSGTANYAFSVARYRTEGTLPFNNEHRNSVLNGTVRLRPDDQTRAELFLRLAERVYHFPTDGSGAITDTNQFTYADETTAGLSARRAVGSRVQLATRLSAHESDGGTDDRPDGPADTLGFYGFEGFDHVRRVAAEVEAGVLLGGTVATLGVELETQRQRSFTESLSEFGPSSERSEYQRDNRAVRLHVTRDDAPVALHAGIRLEDNERYGTFATWQAGATWAPHEGTRLRVAAGRGIKEPTFFEAFATGFARGNPALEPERSLSFEAGLDRDVGAHVRARGTVFRQAFRDLIQYTATPPAEGDPSFFNVASARASGLELAVDGEVGPMRVTASWTWLRTEVLDGGFQGGEGAEFEEGAPLLRRPGHRVALHAAWRGGPWLLAGDLGVVGARQDLDFSTFPSSRVEMTGYTTVGLSAGLELVDGGGRAPATRVTFEADNLLDEPYQEVLGFDAPGRAFYLGLHLGIGGGR